jgi:hypothetical protein
MHYKRTGYDCLATKPETEKTGDHRTLYYTKAVCLLKHCTPSQFEAFLVWCNISKF